MDPKSSYLLEIRISGNPKKRRKGFGCFSFSKVVDSDLCNFKDLVGEIVDQYPHGYEEIVHVFYRDGVKKCFHEVTTDQELLEMFSKHIEGKVVHMTITYSEPKDVVPIPEWYTPENSEVFDIPCTPSIACPYVAAASQSTELITFSQPTKQSTDQTTEPFSTQSSEHITHDADSESDDDDAVDDDDEYLANPEPQNEHVGVDDEGIYLARPKTCASEEKDSESDSESDEDFF